MYIVFINAALEEKLKKNMARMAACLKRLPTPAVYDQNIIIYTYFVNQSTFFKIVIFIFIFIFFC